MRPVCHGCGESYSPNGGGHCPECHKTFSSDSAASQHRVGPYDPPGMRVCVPVASTPPWRLSKRGWTTAPPMGAGVRDDFEGGG